MNGDIAKAKRYRERAEGLRAIAEDMPTGNVRRLILSIALEYERLAGLLEKADPSDDPMATLAALKRPDDSR
jgi:hypothetical protein